MLIGVISFSFVNGSLTSIVSSMDNNHAEYKETMAKFEKVSKKFNFPDKLKIMIKKSSFLSHEELDYEDKDVTDFLKALPYNIRKLASHHIYKPQLEHISFFKSKSHCIKEFFSTKFQIFSFSQDEPILETGDNLQHAFFLV